MKNLLAYGTLMCDDIMQEVSTHAFKGERALLTGYSRRAVIDQPYPALIESDGEQLWGVLYREVPTDVWPRLDSFEGPNYARRAVQVKLASGEMLEAEVYVVEEVYRHHVSSELWDYEHFLEKGRQQFESNYAGYKAL